MDKARIQQILMDQRRFYQSGVTKDVSYRIQVLKKFHEVIRDNHGLLLGALKEDMSKPKLEAYASEIALVLNEIRYAIKKLPSWTRPKRVMTTPPLIPSLCYTIAEPFGVALILAPWNYPFQLAAAPLVGAMAAGNCAVVKPSELAPHTSEAMVKIIQENFDPRYISVVTGGPETAQQLLEERFDYIFFTGGSRIGRIVMEAAARHLTPVTLELGGKNPCFIDTDVHLVYAARRIVWAKFFNAGQTCVAPDYLLVDKAIKDEFVDTVKQEVIGFFGSDPSKSPDYARIINQGHFNRLSSYLTEGDIVVGGQTLPDQRFIAPTVIDNVSPGDSIMQEEVFGPLLPVLSFTDFSEAIDFVNQRPKPLALYLFSRDRNRQQRVEKETSSGGYCINDAVVHFVSHLLPFGGVGDSGMGAYHGKASFDTFSHTKSVVRNTLLFDIPLRYVPYRFKFQLVKRFF